MKCEYCSAEHNGSYGSGRFCNKSCQQGYVASKNHNGGKYDRAKAVRNPPENRTCSFCNQTFLMTSSGIKTHEHCCKSNPNHRVFGKRAKMSDEGRKNVSEARKRYLQQGKRQTGWADRHDRTPSYPEKFFMRLIEEKINDKDYVREHPLAGFFIDFAWKHRKLAIEIDGSQHDRPIQKESDKRKDKAIQEAGWKIIRIKWKVLKSKTLLVTNVVRNLFGEI